MNMFFKDLFRHESINVSPYFQRLKVVLCFLFITLSTNYPGTFSF